MHWLIKPSGADMSFSQWLRRNSEHYLVIAAQDTIARRHDVAGPIHHGGVTEFFWLRLFVPIYRVLPWPLRHKIMRSMPGSHRKDWQYPSPPSGPAI
jgi:hypothetical protein